MTTKFPGTDAENERRQDLGLPIIPEAPGHQCVKGWLGETTDGLPVPCLTCRPWLRKKRPAQQDPANVLNLQPVVMSFSRSREKTNKTTTQKDK